MIRRQAFALTASITVCVVLAQIACRPAARCEDQTTTTAGLPDGHGKPVIGRFGLDETAMDVSRRPGNRFDDYANGTWKAHTEIPADMGEWGTFFEVAAQRDERIRTIVQDASKQSGDKVGDFYQSYMDVEQVQRLGSKPIEPWLREIEAISTKTDALRAMGKLQRIGVTGLFSIHIDQDQMMPDRNAATIEQSVLGMPGRQFYLENGPEFAKTRASYKEYLIKLLQLVGQRDAEPRASAVIAFEQELARSQWSEANSRDSDKTNNKVSLSDLMRQASSFDWSIYLDTLGLGSQPTYIVAQPSAVIAAAQSFSGASLPTIRDYLMTSMLCAYARFLSAPFEEADFAFRGAVLAGTSHQPPRWKRGVSLVSAPAAMGFEVGRRYVARYFSAETKASAEQLVRNVIAAMSARLDQLSWMSAPTKIKAKEKLATFQPIVGYPPHWRDFSNLQIQPDDLVGNVARMRSFDYQRRLDLLKRPFDKADWFGSPLNVDASPLALPAGILAPPFFDPNADPAVNYGSIGAAIGHELSHLFDDQGRKVDPTGRLAEWWTNEDIARFDALTQKLVDQYDRYEPLSGVHVQGALTLGENIADLAGLTVAYDAYHASLNGKTPGIIDGLTGDQRFFLGYAQMWRTKYREAELRTELLTNPHPPGGERIATVRNIDAWYNAFSVAPTDSMYLSPEHRVRIW